MTIVIIMVRIAIWVQTSCNNQLKMTQSVFSCYYLTRSQAKYRLMENVKSQNLRCGLN